jgi:hypothetical protein
MQCRAFVFSVPGSTRASQYLHDLFTAVQRWEPLVADMERALGPNHPDTIDVRDALARARRPDRSSAGRAAGESLPELQKLVRAQVDARGEGHLNTIWAQIRVATALREHDQFDEARTAFDLVLTECLRSLGPTHPATLDVRVRIASVRQRQGETASLIPEVSQVLGDCELALGRRTLVTITAATMLTVLYGAAQRFAEADSMLDDWHPEIIEVLGFENELTRVVLAQRTLRQFGIVEL